MIKDLQFNNKYFAEIAFENDTTIKRSTLYLLDDGFIHLYSIDKEKGLQLNKMQPDPTYTLSVKVKTINYTGKALPLISEIDTAKKDTSYVPPFEEYYKLDDYTGKIGCPFPIKEDELAEVKRIVIAENLEDSKLEKAKINIQEMDSACVLVEQTQQIMLIFEYEETKLDFAKFMYQYTFDLENYKILSEVFNFENSMEELLLFIKEED
ncbi:MAG: DUF4476 domain-containing protein [Vicingaceae bacterium]|nr:DUF4476 domain-containing protein [Vicingaceae bacterium]